jgi:hypothetical protein
VSDGIVMGATEDSTREEMWADLVATREHYDTLVERVHRLSVKLGVPADAGFEGIEQVVDELLAGYSDAGVAP